METIFRKLYGIRCWWRGHHLVSKEASDEYTTISWCRCGEVMWVVKVSCSPCGTTSLGG